MKHTKLLCIKIEYINYYKVIHILKNKTQKDCGCRDMRSVFKPIIVQLEKFFEPDNSK